MSQAKSVLVRHKIVPPGLPAAAISRPRLTQMYADLLEEHEALAVFAAAGSGKTVQAQLFALTEKWPIAWLTLDRGDHSTSRMLSYLAAALDAHVPTASKVLESAFGGTSIVEEAAAILAEAIDVPRLLVVIDHCEAIADAEQSCSALETFLDYLPAGVRTMLLSRSELQFSLGRLLLHGRVGRIVDEDLALTLDEAKELVEARHEDEGDLSDRWEAARGWIAGVAFGGPRRPGGHDRARDFSSYLSSEVIGGLTADERRFMIDTSILDAVSQRAATALCGASSRSVWRSVGMRHLPATTSTDRVIVYHPCLRKYLREQLELEDPARMEMLQQRYASLLLDQHQYEEAVELLLSLGMRAEAADAAAKACLTVTERGDWETFLRWVDEIGPDLVNDRPLLLGQLIKSLRGARRLPEARALARELDSSGRLPEVLEADPGVIAHVAWSMLFQPAEGLSFLDRYDAGRRAAGVRYMLEVTSSDDPVLPPRGVPWTDTDRLISWALMVQGRLDDLVAMLPSGDEWPPRTPYSTPHPLFGLIWRGELARARELYEQVPLTARCRNFPDLWLYLEAWLLLAEGDAASALDAAERAVAHSRQTGFGFESVFEIVQGSALVALGRPADAVGVLTEALEESERTGVVAYQDWAHTGIGRAQLELREDESARRHLRIAVEGMQRSSRLLMLPLAAVYLSEAEWRLGDTERADAAAAVALDASVQMKAFPALQVALSHFPSVYRRQLERAPDAEWRRVGSTTRAAVVVNRPEYSGAVIAVDVHPFGPNPDIYVGGEPANVRRLKVLELAAYLAARPGGIPRHDVQAHLFPESDRRKGSNHFRQVVHQLRRSTTLTLQRLPNSLISWSAGFSVDATDLRFGRALVQARALTGEERLHRLCSALDLVDGGYLIASDLGWVSDRRFEFEVLQEEAELEVARLALDFGQYDLARETAEALLARNPYSDVAYRVLIETELAVGSEAAALAVYRRSVAALAELGLAPDQDMARLLQRSTA